MMPSIFDKSIYIVFGSVCFIALTIIISQGFSEKKLFVDCIVPPTVYTRDIVQFSDKTEGAKEWLWDFGDKSAKSSLQNPTHFYRSEGTFLVGLTVNNKYSITKEIKVGSKPVPVTIRHITPAVEWTPRTPRVGEKVIFKDITPESNFWQWEFDESDKELTSQQFSYTFSEAGKKIIRLKVKGNDFVGETNFTIEVREKPRIVKETNPVPIDNISWTILFNKTIEEKKGRKFDDDYSNLTYYLKNFYIPVKFKSLNRNTLSFGDFYSMADKNNWRLSSSVLKWDESNSHIISIGVSLKE